MTTDQAHSLIEQAAEAIATWTTPTGCSHEREKAYWLSNESPTDKFMELAAEHAPIHVYSRLEDALSTIGAEGHYPQQEYTPYQHSA